MVGSGCVVCLCVSGQVTMGKGCKVVVCGMASVGKTAILEQLLYGTHTAGMCEQYIQNSYQKHPLL